MIIFGILLIVIGALLVISFLLNIINCRTKIKATISKIVKKSIKLRGKSINQYTPIFSYIVDNRTYNEKANLSTFNKNKFIVGQKLDIFIDAKNPKRIKYKNDIGYFVSGVIIALLGILISIF